MIKSYLKAALASMWQRKWFSLLTLFSIAISLVVVTSGASMWNMITAPIAPEVNKDRTFFLRFELLTTNGSTKLDYFDALKYLPNGFFSNDMYQFKTPELTTVYQSFGYSELIRNNKTKKIELMRADPNFFKIFEFEFVAGKPYNQANNTDEIMALCVISDEFASYYFGDDNCIGQIVSDKDNQYKVVGVIKKPVGKTSLKSDIYYQTNTREVAYNQMWYNVAFLCHSSKDKQALDAELKHQVINSNDGQVILSSDSSAIQYLTQLIGFKWELLPLYLVFILIALIIPILCLVDILKNNQSHRNEELAIRRAFGAPRTTITALLLIDNLLVTTVGGMLGLVFSFLFFAALNEDSWSNLFFVFFNWRAFFYYIAVFLLIGGIAGILPAYRLSKQQIVTALNGIEHD